jgi:hypothetical protein
MSKEIKNLKEDIMNRIHDEKIKMKPKLYFIVGSILTFTGLVSSVVISVFLIGLIRFFLRSHGPMVNYRLDQILSNFPWWAAAFSILGLIFGIYFLRKYDFSFKVNFKFIIIGFILAAIIGGWLVDNLGLNDLLIKRGPMQGIMRQYKQDNNIYEGQGLYRNFRNQ